MSLNDDIALMKKVRLFAGFDDDQLRLLAFGTQRKALPKGAALFQNGEASKGGYVVASGRIEFTPETIGNTQGEAEIAHVGTLLGAINMIIGKQYSGTAIALEAGEVLCIPQETFMRMMNEFPELALLVHERLSDNVQETAKSLEAVRNKLK